MTELHPIAQAQKPMGAFVQLEWTTHETDNEF